MVFDIFCRYAKVYLLPDRSRSSKKKTKVKKHTLSPVFEENLKVDHALNRNRSSLTEEPNFLRSLRPLYLTLRTALCG